MSQSNLGFQGPALAILATSLVLLFVVGLPAAAIPGFLFETLNKLLRFAMGAAATFIEAQRV